MNTKLPQSYWNLTKLTETLLHHCEKHGIMVWPEFGSLIAWARHGGGLIPWDYDGDFGIFAKDKYRFLQSFTAETSPDIVTDVDYYNDAGCLAFYLRSYPDDIIDIIFYRETDIAIDSLQNDTTKRAYPSNDNYCYQKQDFYPLTKSLMLGHLVHIPYNWDKILTIHYSSWREYPEKFQNFISQEFLASSFKQIPRYTTNDFGRVKELVETMNVPFILDKTELLSCTQQKYSQIVEKQTSEIYGYQSSISWSYLEEPAVKVWSDYLNRSLKHNVVDSPIDDKSILPIVWNEYVKNKLGEWYKLALCWVLTNSPKITHFHTDPEYAGGYMKLISGEKIWWCIAPEDYHYLCSKGYSVSTLATLQIHELLQIEDNYLFGKIYVGMISDDDLLWFPVNTLHKVITTKDSYGFGGYL